MGQTATAGFPSPSARTVERTLAALLVGLLATYALGTVANGLLAPLHTAGVVAIHLAVVIGFVFPVAVLGRALGGRIRSRSTRPRRIEEVTALVVLCCLAVGLWLGTTQAPDRAMAPLLGVAAGGSLVLAGLVFGDS